MPCRAPKTLAVVILIVAAPATGQDDVHWAIALGGRVEMVHRAFPVVDQVVLVPDAATYLDELSRWSPRGRWPVLLEDDHFAPMFIRRFEPAQVIRRSPAGGVADRRRLESVVLTTWGGDPRTDTPAEVFARANHVPPGVVITSLQDPAWTAAVALAAGHGQPLAWLDEPFGGPNQLLEPGGLRRLRAAVDRLVVEAGDPHAGVGDAIDTITLCRDVAGRADIASGADSEEIRAVTDLLGRGPAGQRYAFTGWIFGGEIRCAYAAMSALFLDRSRFWLYDTYADPAVVGAYGMEEAARLLDARAFEVSTFDGDQTTVQSWLGNVLPGGVSTDVLVMNSGGESTAFALRDDRVYCGDVPVLNRPLALHFTHSFSLKAPAAAGTIGGQWLAHGVYAYLGSVDEPRLAGFIPPKFFVDRCVNLVPFLVAGRKWDDSPPWKIQTIGDPLMICRSPLLPRPPRLAPPPPGDADRIDVNEHAKTLMRQAATDKTGVAMSQAMATLDLLGADDVAIRLWQLAAQDGLAEAAAAGAMGPLFRARLTEEFCRAWAALPAPDPVDRDMLWHLMGPRLRFADDDVLIMVQSSIRRCQVDADVARLAPHLTAAFGAAHTRSLIQRELDRIQNPRRRRNLQKLLANPN